MSRLLERLRWRVAPPLGRLPSFCWADLVMWANGNGDRLPRRSVASCRADMSGCGTCYCGKFQDEARMREYVAEFDAKRAGGGAT